MTNQDNGTHVEKKTEEIRVGPQSRNRLKEYFQNTEVVPAVFFILLFTFAINKRRIIYRNPLSCI